jgi:hypothetical protein
MVFEKSTGKVLLFGGGRNQVDSTQGWGIAFSMGDTWEWDPTTAQWNQRQTTVAPSPRHDAGLAWDHVRNRAILFGGMMLESQSSVGIPKQDTWEWDPLTSTWTERTMEGTKPSARFGHAFVSGPTGGKAFLYGGFDIASANGLGDLWEWDVVTGVWTARLTEARAGLPNGRIYASLAIDPVRNMLILFAGATSGLDSVPSGTGGMSMGGSIASTGGVWGGPTTGMYGAGGAVSGGWGGEFPNLTGFHPVRDLWDLDLAQFTFNNRSLSTQSPGPRMHHALAFCPPSGMTYLFGGQNEFGQLSNDLWAWDGKTWVEIKTVVQPSLRNNTAMTYDPGRKTILLYGGYRPGFDSNQLNEGILSDTWEWNCITHTWAQLKPQNTPMPLEGHGMVSDHTRGKVLLFGGRSTTVPITETVDQVGYQDPIRNEIWEWDGATLTWTNRNIAGAKAPTSRQFPSLSYDDARQKLFLYEGNNTGWSVEQGAYWEWDPHSAGWSFHDGEGGLNYGSLFYSIYDPIRRRQILITDALGPTSSFMAGDTWELEPKAGTWFVRNIANSPITRFFANTVFDSQRGVVVLVGGTVNGFAVDETWEYQVTNLANGAGCSATSAGMCSSGNCVDGVCCGSVACSGPCQSCAVEGQEGTCIQAAAGTEVPGSCASGQACDGLGACKVKNGQPCTTGASCASGFCTDGVCCESDCKGTCSSCKQPGQEGRCTPYQAGTDPQGECSLETGPCKASCDGVGACAFAEPGTTCGGCLVCNGNGQCDTMDWRCNSGVGGSTGDSPWTGGSTWTGGTPWTGGSIWTGGTPWNQGGAAGNPGYTNGGSIVLPGGGWSHSSGGSLKGGLPSFGGSQQQLGGSPMKGGNISGTGGAGGSVGLRDAGPDGAAIDAVGSLKIHDSGCSCDVGHASTGSPGWPLVFLAIGFVIRTFRRKGRREN